MADNREAIRLWIKGLLDNAPYGTKSKLAKHLSIQPAAITRMVSDEPGKEGREVSAPELLQIADYFGVSLPDFSGITANGLSGSTVSPSKVGLQPVVSGGIAGAGAWREFDDFDQSEREVFYEPADPQFPNARLLSFDVDGDSMNDLKPRPIFHGDRAIALAFEDVQDQVPLRDGMVVVVQRLRDGGHIVEMSIKQVEFYRDRIEFCPRSTNPRHKPIVVKHEDDKDDGTTVSVIAWVRRINNNLP